MHRPLSLLAVGAITLAATACGSQAVNPKARSGATTAATRFQRELQAATRSSTADFAATHGRTLQQMAKTVKAGTQLGLATSVFTLGRNRLAFGIIDSKGRFVYAKTAIYLAPKPGAPAEGPYPAPADPLIVDPAYRSKTSASETSRIAAIYASEVPLRRPGRYAVLAVTKAGAKTLGSTGEIKVSRTTPIPAVGQRPPGVSTDTVRSAGGDLAKIDTRIPHDDMHRADFKNVLGKRPVALLFSTPQLCHSKVCGPVTDIAVQLERIYGNRMTFIHEEVNVDNDPNKGLRAPLKAFGLQTEPWLFTFDRSGRVAARLEGSFGTTAFRRAVEAALATP